MAVFKEIHGRFTADQKLGNLFAWDGVGLRYRTPVADFYRRSLELRKELAVEATPAEIDARVSALARKMFGGYIADAFVAVNMR